MKGTVLQIIVALPLVVLGGAAAIFLVNVPHGSISDQENDLRLIRLMIENYRLANLHNPPAYTLDEHGNRVHSWRALLLLFCGDPTVESAYSFDEPWDSKANEAVGQSAPDFYVDSSRGSHRRSESDYQAVLDYDNTVQMYGRKVPTVADVEPAVGVRRQWTAP